jgi:hypothetical protein
MKKTTERLSLSKMRMGKIQVNSRFSIILEKLQNNDFRKIIMIFFKLDSTSRYIKFQFFLIIFN